MGIKRILYLFYGEDIPEIEHSNIEVIVELKDGYSYTVDVATLENIDYLIKKDKMNYLGPAYPTIIVKNLTKDSILEAIKVYEETNDGYLLKLYHIDMTVFDSLQAEAQELPELDNS
jgi:hypothetical protein